MLPLTDVSNLSKHKGLSLCSKYFMLRTTLNFEERKFSSLILFLKKKKSEMYKTDKSLLLLKWDVGLF